MNPTGPLKHAPGTGVDSQNPWPGLVAFTEELQDFFHGRGEEADELLRRVERKNLTVLFGQSGLGKSSILQAGLFPRLRAEGYLPIPIRLDHATSSPPLSEQVMAAATKAIIEAGGQWEGAVPVAIESLWEYLHRRDLRLETADGRPIHPVLVFDQFEELFAIGQASEATRSRAGAFLADLADFVENRAPESLERRLEEIPELFKQLVFDDRDYRVLVCLREDYLAQVEGLRRAMPSITENRMRLTRMTGTRALDAVTIPGGHLIAPEVARQIVRFVAGGGMRSQGGSDHPGEEAGLADLEVEPSLLSLVCRELNNRRIALGLPQISSDLVAGNRERILQDFYDGCLADQPEAVRAFVEDELVTDSGLRENIALERAISALGRRGAPASTIDDLIRRRLLRLEDRLDIQRVELTHDVLTSVVRTSRDERQNREAMLRAEREARAVRERSRRQRRKLQFVVAGMTAALVVVSGFGLATAVLYRISQRSLLEVEIQRKRAEKGEQVAHRALADGLILQGDALRLAGRCSYSRKTLTQSLEESKQLGLPSLRAKLVLWNLYAESPPELMTFPGHVAGIQCVAFSPDGRWALSGSKDNTVKLWDLVRGVQKWTLDGHTLPVRDVCFSPDGRWALSGSDDTTVKLWDLTRGTEKMPFPGHTQAVRCVCFSPDGRSALSGGMDGTVRIWDIETGEQKAELSAHDKGVNCVAFSPDGRMALSGGGDKLIRLWEMPGGSELKELSGHGASVTSVAFSPDGRTAVSGSLDHQVMRWDLESGKSLNPLSTDSIDGNRIAFSRDGSKALSTGVPRSFSSHGQPSPSSTDGRVASSGGAETVLTLWDVRRRSILRTISAYTDHVAGVALSPDGRTAFVGTAEDSLELLDLGPGDEISTLACGSLVTSVAFSPDGLTALSGGQDHKIKLWDLESGKELHTFLGHTKAVTSIAFSPTDRTLLSGAEDSTMRLWSIDDGLERWEVKAALIRGRVAGVAFSPDGRTGLSGSDDRTLELWDIDSGRKKQTLSKSSEQYSGFRGVAISHQGDAVLACSTDTFVKLWHLSGDGDPRTFSGHTEAVNCVAFSPDGRVAVSGSSDHTVRLWDVESGRTEKVLSGHVDEVNGIFISIDGRTLLSGGKDDVLKLWDVEGGKELLTFVGHKNDVKSVALLQDRDDPERLSAALSGSSDETMKVWRIGRVDRYIEFNRSLPLAKLILSRSPSDPKSLADLGSWYAFRGVSAWAVELLEEARSVGAMVSPLMLARCYWKLDRRPEARKEFERALEQGEAPADYLRLCIAAVDSEPARPDAGATPGRN